MKKKDRPILNFIIKSTNGMAHGLFCTLIIGTILSTIASFFNEESIVCVVLSSLAQALKLMTGAGIGIGIALALKQDGLKLVSLGLGGEIASFMAGTWSKVNDKFQYDFYSFGFKVGDPLTIYLVVIGVFLLIKLILKKKSSVDIILIPLLTSILSLILTLLLSYPIQFLTTLFGSFINSVTYAHPFIFGIVIAVFMGMALTAPISSAAIAIAFSISGLAGGAAVVGCSIQMLGFAIEARRDNKVATLLSIGIGTSMLEFKNIIKKPVIWAPTIIASAILGPITTCLFKTTCTPSGAGMGTSGLVGIFGVIDSMGTSARVFIVNIILGLIVLPIVLVFIIDLIFYRLGIIKKGDFTI